MFLDRFAAILAVAMLALTMTITAPVDAAGPSPDQTDGQASDTSASDTSDGASVGKKDEVADKQAEGPAQTDAKKEKKTPEQRMQSRFPQPARVGDLIGLPVLDDDDVTLGRVRDVVRTRDGKVVLVVDYSPWFGWFGWRTRPVAVPIETVAILARQIAAVDMPPKEFAAAPTWSLGDSKPIGKDEKIRIAVTRR
jgi:hypothetical protein